MSFAWAYSPPIGMKIEVDSDAMPSSGTCAFTGKLPPSTPTHDIAAAVHALSWDTLVPYDKIQVLPRPPFLLKLLISLWLGSEFQCLSPHALGSGTLRFSEFIPRVGEEGMGLEVIRL
jgi:hypothetical protein